ncbi:MAG: branched-chain amino acid transport system II carrier protein [Chlamydiales bacterium]|nr:branched-chain amino acid transport system II carrier protein [Chlamydiales bacterium]
MTKKNHSSVIAAGLALFSMFFGAGDLIWPIILGGQAGSQNFYAMLGLIITGVSLPLLGLISMMLFEGNYRAFFGRIGKLPSIFLIFIIQAILGPIGSIPRLITLSYATLQPYMPENITLIGFSILASLFVLCFTLKKQRVIDLLGLVLTPLLLISLGGILVMGFYHAPDPLSFGFSKTEAFTSGLNVGYNTLDLIASFIFAPLVLAHFIHDENTQIDKKTRSRMLFRKMLKACLIAAGLLSGMYVGLTYVSSFYTPLLDPNLPPEARLSGISMYLLGHYGSIVSSVAVAMACLTTAIPLVSICADYIKQDLFQDKVGRILPLIITLSLSCFIANFGFTGIANMLSPVLQVLCPGLIVLSLSNIGYKLYETRFAKIPFFATFTLSIVGYLM